MRRKVGKRDRKGRRRKRRYGREREERGGKDTGGKRGTPAPIVDICPQT